MIRTLTRSLFHYDSELGKIQDWIFRLAGDRRSGFRILDVGCGYGRNLEWLKAKGFNATGVEANPGIVKACRDAGLSCLDVKDFQKTTDQYDMLLMAHIVE